MFHVVVVVNSFWCSAPNADQQKFRAGFVGEGWGLLCREYRAGISFSVRLLRKAAALQAGHWYIPKGFGHGFKFQVSKVESWPVVRKRNDRHVAQQAKGIGSLKPVTCPVQRWKIARDAVSGTAQCTTQRWFLHAFCWFRNFAAALSKSSESTVHDQATLQITAWRGGITALLGGLHCALHLMPAMQSRCSGEAHRILRGWRWFFLVLTSSK